MTKNISYYENIFDNISEVILLMEGQFFIYANLSALTLFEVDSKEELYLLHPSNYLHYISQMANSHQQKQIKI